MAEAYCPSHRKGSSHSCNSVDVQEPNLKAQIPTEIYFVLTLWNYQVVLCAQTVKHLANLWWLWFSDAFILHIMQVSKYTFLSKYLSLADI